VYLTRATPIGERETAGRLHERLAALAAEALTEALPALLRGALTAEPQDDSLATHAPKIAKADAPLDWRKSAAELEAQVRAFDPWPVAEAKIGDGRRLRVLEAVELPASAPAAPGTIVALGRHGIDVATSAGVLRLLKVQPPSGRVMEAAAYLAAHRLDGSAFVS
jgi:methionyl-tRNA formyltransferase